MAKSREWRLARRPTGMPTKDDFELGERELGEPGEGEVLVRNVWMSVDPYMRGRMSERKSYVASFEVGRALAGGAVGRVEASADPSLSVGDWVLSQQGWRERFVSKAEKLQRIDPGLAPPEAFLGVLGMPGLTAYVGLHRIAELKEGERVFVTAAAGAVGSVACQLAKAKGCTVVGSAGGEEKTRWLREEAGVDGAIDYRQGHLGRELRRLMPDGIDVDFENVGGEHLEAAISSLRDFGRVAVCGLISQYNAETPEPGPRNFALVVMRRLKLQGFIVSDHLDLMPEFYREVGGLLQAGKIRWRQTVREGLEAAPDAFLGLFRGENLGKMLVRLSED